MCNVIKLNNDNSHVSEEIMEELQELLQNEADYWSDYYCNNEDNPIADFVLSMNYGDHTVTFNELFEGLLSEGGYCRNTKIELDNLYYQLSRYLSEADQQELVDHIIDCRSELVSGDYHNPLGYPVNASHIGEIEIELSPKITDLADQYDIDLSLVDNDFYIMKKYSELGYLNCNHYYWYLTVDCDFSDLLDTVMEFLFDDRKAVK